MFSAAAEIYNEIYAFKDYGVEATKIRQPSGSQLKLRAFGGVIRETRSSTENERAVAGVMHWQESGNTHAHNPAQKGMPRV